MQFRIARTGAKTGRLLERLLDAQYPPHERPDAVICYGVGYSGPLPALNANAGRLNKLEQGLRLVEGLGAQAIPILTFEQAMVTVEHFPVLGRKLHHAQGRDIVPILEQWMLEDTREHLDFYTPYVDSTAEYRTWVYRNRHLGTYRKVLAHPEQFKRLGRNRRNGFVFERVENDVVPEQIKALSRSAVRTLGLDFGAVDLLGLRDGGHMVLEVNAAPGVQDERRAVIQGLVHRIIRWAANGCPRRSDGD